MKPNIRSYEEIYLERLEREHDPQVISCAKKIPGFIEDCMRICLNEALDQIEENFSLEPKS